MQHAYVVVEGATHQLSGVGIFALPLTPNSQPLGLLKGNFGQSDCADNQGRLFVVGGGLHVFTQPITVASKEAFQVVTSHLATNCAFDSNGNLYVSNFQFDLAGYLDVFAAPVQAGSRPIKTIYIGYLAIPEAVTTDASGDVFVYALGPVEEFSPLSSGNTLLATFGAAPRRGLQSGIAIGPDGNLYVANTTTEGVIDVYVPADFHNGGVRDHSIPVANGEIGYIAFDNAGNMIVVVGHEGPPNQLYVFPPPYTAGRSVVLLTYPGSIGIAITQ